MTKAALEVWGNKIGLKLDTTIHTMPLSTNRRSTLVKAAKEFVRNKNGEVQ
jgi:hypothetical protein